MVDAAFAIGGLGLGMILVAGVGRRVPVGVRRIVGVFGLVFVALAGTFLYFVGAFPH